MKAAPFSTRDRDLLVSSKVGVSSMKAPKYLILETSRCSSRGHVTKINLWRGMDNWYDEKLLKQADIDVGA